MGVLKTVQPVKVVVVREEVQSLNKLTDSMTEIESRATIEGAIS